MNNSNYNPRKKLGERVAIALRQAYIDNEYEVPSIEERRKLSEELGVTLDQIRNWYKHAKRSAAMQHPNFTVTER